MTAFPNKYVILLLSKFLTFHTLVHESIRNNPRCQTPKLMVKANYQEHRPSFEKLKAETIQATIYLEIRSNLRFQNSSPKLLPSIDSPAFQQKILEIPKLILQPSPEFQPLSTFKGQSHTKRQPVMIKIIRNTNDLPFLSTQNTRPATTRSDFF